MSILIEVSLIGSFTLVRLAPFEFFITCTMKNPKSLSLSLLYLATLSGLVLRDRIYSLNKDTYHLANRKDCIRLSTSPPLCSTKTSKIYSFLEFSVILFALNNSYFFFTQIIEFIHQRVNFRF